MTKHIVFTPPRKNFGVEVLRIAAMLMIVAHHFSVHGGYDFPTVSANSLIVDALALGGKIGVNIFVLITGYYSLNSKFSISKLVRIVLQVTFYALLTYGISVLVGAQELRKKYLLQAMLPFIFGDEYWFIVSYVELYFLIPLLNAAVRHTTKHQLGTVIVFLLLVWCILPRTIGTVLDLHDYGFGQLGWFVLIYLIGAYLRLFSCPLYRHRRMTAALLSGCWLVLVVCTVINASLIGVESTNLLFRISKRAVRTLSNASQNAVLSVAISVLMLIFFQQLQLKPRKWLYAVATSTFGVYLIHDGPWLRKFLWKSICHTTTMASTQPAAVFLMYAFVCVAAVFCFASVMEIARKNLIEKPFFEIRYIKNKLSAIDGKVSELL